MLHTLHDIIWSSCTWAMDYSQLFLGNRLSCDRRSCNFQFALMLIPPCMLIKRCVCVFCYNLATSAEREKKKRFCNLSKIYPFWICIQMPWSHEYIVCYYFTTMNVYSVCIFAWFIRRKFFFELYYTLNCVLCGRRLFGSSYSAVGLSRSCP